MPFYLRHPRHGEKVAISEMEVAADLRNGWVQFDPSAPPPSDDGEVVNNLEVKRRRRTSEV